MFLVMASTFLVLLLSAAWYYYSTRLRHIAGPKLVLAKAIASAASAYFVVPATLIQAKLLLDAQIVLQNVQLRPQSSTILATKNGSTFTIRTTGTVKRVTFSWNWALSNAWVQNAKLAITGVQIHVKISSESDGNNTSSSSNTTQQQQEADDEADTEQAGGFHGIIQRQVQMVLDTLDLSVSDVELAIELPEDAADPLHKGMTVQIGTEAFALTSSGRLGSRGVLQQPASLTAFYANVLLDGGKDATAATTTAPLMDPFTYSVDTTRTGQRFADWRTNVVVVGQSATDFVVHAGSVQLCALSRLGALLTALPSDSNNRRNPPQQDSDKTGDAASSQESKAPISEYSATSF